MVEHNFGGDWTVLKLDMLKKYLPAFTTALQNIKPKLVYIDAFAGTGSVTFDDGTAIAGSARIALETTPAFDEYYFIDLKPEHVSELEKLKAEYPDKAHKMKIIKADCNEFLAKFCKNPSIKYCRGVLFLDPYSMSVPWSTLECIASTKVFDIWYLFPLSAVNRMLKSDGKLEEFAVDKLNFVLGNTDWRSKFYRSSPQMNLFNELEDEKKDTQEIVRIWKERMQDAFPYVYEYPLILRNQKNSPLFALCFAISNDAPAPIRLAKKIASDIFSKANNSKISGKM